MSQPLLSILIPATPDRIDDVTSLVEKIVIQTEVIRCSSSHTEIGSIIKYKDVNNYYEVIIFFDDKKMTIGEKREQLYKLASGKYSWQIDSDDSISEDAISLITMAMITNPDCITFEESCAMNGEYYSSNHSLKYNDWADDFDGYNFVRMPFYKDVIKTEIAKSVPFEHIRYSEDHAWSRALKPHLKSEVHIDKEVYFYIHNSKPEEFQTRYGFDKQ